MNKPVYKHLAIAVDAYHRCTAPAANPTQREWASRWVQRVEKMVKNHLPSGAGIDGLRLDIPDSSGELLQFRLNYHHMNDNGFYTHWTRHIMTVTPSMIFEFDLEFESPDDGDFDVLYEHFSQTYQYALSEEVPEEV